MRWHFQSIALIIVVTAVVSAFPLILLFFGTKYPMTLYGDSHAHEVIYDKFARIATVDRSVIDDRNRDLDQPTDAFEVALKDLSIYFTFLQYQPNKDVAGKSAAPIPIRRSNLFFEYYDYDLRWSRSRSLRFSIYSGLVLSGFLATIGICFLTPRVRKVLRIRAGLCRKCGYDLRGIYSSRCPECGTPIPVTPGVNSVSTIPHDQRSANGTSP